MLEQDTIWRTIPDAGPGVICPKKAKREGRPARLNHLRKRSLENLLTSKPKVIISEALDSICGRQARLVVSSFGEAQVIETKLPR